MKRDKCKMHWQLCKTKEAGYSVDVNDENAKNAQFSDIIQVKTSHTDTFGGQTAVRSTGRARLSAQGGVFKQDLTGKLLGTGQNCSFKRGVRLVRVFVRRGSTVFELSNFPVRNPNLTFVYIFLHIIFQAKFSFPYFFHVISFKFFIY